MYLEHLVTFVNLVETLNFSKTALNLHMSQSAVSQAIASVERQLGVTLFYRSRKAVALTPAGRDLYDRIKPWLNEYNKSVQHVQQVERLEQTNLTIGYSGTPYENALVPELVHAFALKHPKVRIFMENYAHQELKEHLAHGSCDVIFTMPDIVAGIDNFAYHNLVVGEYCLIVPTELEDDGGERLESPERSGRLPLSELAGRSLVFLDHRWCPPSQEQLQEEIRRKVAAAAGELDLAYVNNIATAHAMVKARQGLGIWANFVSDPRDSEGLRRLPLDTSIVPRYGVAILKQNQNEAARKFVAWLEKTGMVG